MKKTIYKGLLFILIGFFLGDFLLGNKKDLLKKIKNSDTYYFLQEGVYSDEDTLKRDLKKLSFKMVDQKDNKYFVYVGITKDKEVVETLTKIYEENGYKIYPKEKELSSEEFFQNVTQFDLLIKQTEDKDQILTIEKVVLANYEEVVKKQ